VSEVTRLGMVPGDMAELARLLARIIIKNEAPEKVRSDVAEFRKT
jgi:glycine/serine hydroxymethyltransferase